MTSTSAQESIAAARELLPAWTIWGNDLLFVATCVLLSLLLTKIAVWVAIRPYQKAQPREWVDQARLAFPARRIVAVAGLVFPILIVLCGFLLHHEPSPISRPWLAVATALFSMLPIIGVYRQVAIQIGINPGRFRDTIRSGAARILLLLPHLVLALAVMSVMPFQFDSRAWLLLALTAILPTTLAVGAHLFLARFLGLAHPASGRLSEIITRSSEKVGVCSKRVYEVDWLMVNALAFPLSARLAFTKTAVEHLTDDELEAICAHELAHLAEPKRIHLLRLVVNIATTLFFPAIIPAAGTFGIPGVLVLLCCFLGMNSMYVKLARRIEQRADATAAASQAASAAYARALEHLYRLNLLPVVTGLKCQTHPELYDRMVACGVQPDYPRPPIPSRRRVLGALVVMLLPIPFVMGTFPFVVNALAGGADSTETSIHRVMILPIDEAWCLDRLGRIRDEEGKFADAVVLFRAASAIDRCAWHYPASLARTYLNANRLDEAEAALREARARNERSQSNSAADKWIDDFEQAIKAHRDVRERIIERVKARRAQHTLM